MFDTMTLETRQQLQAIDQGSVVFVVDNKSQTYAGVPVVGWRGKVSAHLQVPTVETNALKNLGINFSDEVLKLEKEKSEKAKHGKLEGSVVSTDKKRELNDATANPSGEKKLKTEEQ